MELTREIMFGLLVELDDELALYGITGEVALFGGSALCLAYGLRESTHDVDAFFQPSQGIRQAIINIAKRHPGLGEDWLDDGVKDFLYTEPPLSTVWQGTHLRVTTPSQEYLLAMKLAIMRTGENSPDLRDALALCQSLGITSSEQALAVASQWVPWDVIPLRSRYLLMEELGS